jgi:hypothetical protein
MEAACLSDPEDNSGEESGPSPAPEVDNAPTGFTADYNMDLIDQDDEPLDFRPSTIHTSDGPAVIPPTPVGQVPCTPPNDDRYIEEYPGPAGVPIAQGLTGFEASSSFALSSNRRELLPGRLLKLRPSGSLRGGS